MVQTYWLINSDRTRIKRFIKNINSEDRFYNYMFIDTGKIVSLLGNEPPLMLKREELKIHTAREEWKRLLAQGWMQTKEFW